MIYNKYEYGINNVYPTISIKKNNDEETLYLGNLVSFNSKLNKLTLSEKESIFYNIITNNSQKTTLDIPCGNKLFTIEVQDIKTKFNWNKNVFTINTKSLGKLKEYNCNYNLNSKETTNKLNKLTNDYIKNNNHISKEDIKDDTFVSKVSNLHKIFINEKKSLEQSFDEQKECFIREAEDKMNSISLLQQDIKNIEMKLSLTERELVKIQKRNKELEFINLCFNLHYSDYVLKGWLDNTLTETYKNNETEIFNKGLKPFWNCLPLKIEFFLILI